MLIGRTPLELIVASKTDDIVDNSDTFVVAAVVVVVFVIWDSIAVVDIFDKLSAIVAACFLVLFWEGSLVVFMEKGWTNVDLSDVSELNLVDVSELYCVDVSEPSSVVEISELNWE